MKQKNLTKKQMNEIINALWFKFAAYHISTSANNKLSHIFNNNLGESYGDSIEIANMVKMCNDLVDNDRGSIPSYLINMDIYDANDLKIWLTKLKDEEIFSDEEVEILLNDYRSIERALLRCR